MKLIWYVIVFSIIPYLSQARTIRVAVIDTGYYMEDNKSFKSCDNFKYDRNFTDDESMEDIHLHGQNIVHIIADGLENVDYCIINIKALTKTLSSTKDYLNAWRYAKSLHVDIINASLAGEEENKKETKIIKQILNSGTILVAAAGNRRRNLDANCNTYPACIDPRVIIVGALNPNKKTRFKLTNYGKRVTFWEVGVKVKAGGLVLTGTSQATAVRTNKLIKELAKRK